MAKKTKKKKRDIEVEALKHEEAKRRNPPTGRGP